MLPSRSAFAAFIVAGFAQRLSQLADFKHQCGGQSRQIGDQKWRISPGEEGGGCGEEAPAENKQRAAVCVWEAAELHGQGTTKIIIIFVCFLS